MSSPLQAFSGWVQPASSLSASSQPGFARAAVTVEVADLSAFDVTNTDAGAVVEGNTVLLISQTTTPSENGPYVVGPVTGVLAPLTRPSWFASGQTLSAGYAIRLTAGIVFGYTNWLAYQNGLTFVVDTDDPNFYPERVVGKDTLANGTITVSTVPILGTKSTCDIVRENALTSDLTTGGYHPTQNGNNGISPGKIGTAAVIIEACIPDGTKNANDDSDIRWVISNQ